MLSTFSRGRSLPTFRESGRNSDPLVLGGMFQIRTTVEEVASNLIDQMAERNTPVDLSPERHEVGEYLRQRLRMQAGEPMEASLPRTRDGVAPPCPHAVARSPAYL